MLLPPHHSEHSFEASGQFFTAIHGLRSSRGRVDRLLRRTPVLSFEVVSTRQGGIRFVIVAERRLADSVAKSIAALMPDAKVGRIEGEADDEGVFDYGSLGQGMSTKILDFKQTSNYVLPIRLPFGMSDSDPLDYVLGAMTNLERGERITLQIVARPIERRSARALARRLMNNEDILTQLKSDRFNSRASGAGRLLSSTLSGLGGLFSEVYISTAHGYKEYYSSRNQELMAARPVANRERPTRVLSAFESELMQGMNQKLNQPLFEVSLRVVIVSPRTEAHRRAVLSAIDGFSTPLYQGLKSRSSFGVYRGLRRLLVRRRLLALSRGSRMTLSTSELSSLYHFPVALTSLTELMAPK